MSIALRGFLLCFFSLFLLMTSVTYAGAGKPFNKIIFFGDSLSDNGNLYAYDFSYMPKSPPYFEGRFSNQYVWSDLISKSFHEEYGVTETNFAFGGETAIFHNPSRGFLPYTITMSRNSYILRTSFQDRSRTLFIIWIGGNDYLHDSIDVDGLTTQVIASIRATIESLISHGGMNFLIINLPDGGATPYAREAGLSELLHAFVEKHNEKLQYLVDEIANSYKSININLYDANYLFNDLQKNVTYYNKKYKTHLSNLTESCWQGGYSLRKQDKKVTAESIAAEIDAQLKQKAMLTGAINPATKNFSSLDFAKYITESPDLMETYTTTKDVENNMLTPCADPESYAFWDRIHPTRIIHMMFADGISKFIKRRYDIDDSQQLRKASH